MEPWTIGPYRIEGELGAGGMGEVYRAYDERLERAVAVKLIRPESLEDTRAQRRFLREARAAAGLNHPAIVQIHDILEHEGNTCIVMELVEGETLSRLLEEGPLPLPRAVALGREIAEGLAEAHAKGVVHRDLKPGNVMVTAAGHAKILDFGLAKRMWRGGVETSLSAHGEILGTCPAMSPEQAQGYAIDHRSDLFSFGSLLYETASGRHPFRAASPLATLNRVFGHRQAPAREENPQIPEALSELIDRLLEKDPDHRPQSAGEVAAALAELAGSGSLAGTGPPVATGGAETGDLGTTLSVPPGVSSSSGFRRPAIAVAVLLLVAGLWLVSLRSRAMEPLYVAVSRPQIGALSGDPVKDIADLQLVASGVRVAVVRGLLQLEGIYPLAIDQVDAVAGTSVEVARALAADEVISARLDCAGQTCQVALSRIRGRDGSVLWIHDFDIAVDDLRLLTNSVVQNLKTGYRLRQIRREFPDLEVQSADYEDYLRVRSSFQDRRGDVLVQGLLDRLQAIQRSSPRFLEAYVLEAQILRFEYSTSRDPRDLERAFAAIAEARRLAPEDPQPLFGLYMLYLAEKQLDRADQVLAELERLRPGDPTVLAKRAMLEDARGDGQRALATMGTAAARRPSWNNLYNLAWLEYRHGEVAAARGHLHDALERSPGEFRSRTFLAQIELVAGSPAAVDLYSELAEAVSDSRTLYHLGMAHLMMQSYDQAASCFRRSLELEPGDWEHALSLAQAELLLGHQTEAEPMLRHVLELLDQDAAATDHHALAVRAQALAHLGQWRQAAAATQEALHLAPEHPVVAYQASAVYALVGDRVSSLATVEKALGLGLGPRWFQLPWFESLRGDADFQTLLEGAAPGPPQQAGGRSETG